eukprot:gene17138-biopygen4877
MWQRTPKETVREADAEGSDVGGGRLEASELGWQSHHPPRIVVRPKKSPLEKCPQTPPLLPPTTNQPLCADRPLRNRPALNADTHRGQKIQFVCDVSPFLKILGEEVNVFGVKVGRLGRGAVGDIIVFTCGLDPTQNHVCLATEPQTIS